MKLVPMRLGPLEFSLPEGAFSSREYSASYRLDVSEPIEGPGKPTFRGLESERLTIRGVVFPGFSGKLSSVQRFRDFAARGESALLVDGEGTIYGAWFLREVTERQDVFTPTGLPRRIEYDLTLVRDPDEVPL